MFAGRMTRSLSHREFEAYQTRLPLLPSQGTLSAETSSPTLQRPSAGTKRPRKMAPTTAEIVHIFVFPVRLCHLTVRTTFTQRHPAADSTATRTKRKQLFVYRNTSTRSSLPLLLLSAMLRRGAVRLLETVTSHTASSSAVDRK